MSQVIQIRRGITAVASAATLAAGEFFMDTTLNQLRLGDGSTPGGRVISAPLAAFILTLLDDADAAAARGTLVAAKSGANSDITSLSALSTALSVAQGGTGVTSIAALLTALMAAGAYAKTNILGSVSQTSGVPTGAVVERGSNANGEYVKYADGRLECKLVQSTSVAVTTASGPTWLGAAPAWTYPVPFVGTTPWVDLKASASGRVTLTCEFLSGLTSAQSTLIDLVSSTTNTYKLTYIAIGRWF